ncbi:hypothetical protein D9M72_557610 [compost metagenome]
MAGAAAQVQHAAARAVGCGDQRGQFVLQLLQVRAAGVDGAGEVGAGGGAELGGDEFLLLHGAGLLGLRPGGRAAFLLGEGTCPRGGFGIL